MMRPENCSIPGWRDSPFSSRHMGFMKQSSCPINSCRWGDFILNLKNRIRRLSIVSAVCA
jgi:hypothetical protein